MQTDENHVPDSVVEDQDSIPHEAASAFCSSYVTDRPLNSTYTSSGNATKFDINSEHSKEYSSDAAWKGWAELENDPLIFSTLLREWGVSDIQVNEVVPLDSVFDTPPDVTLGLIFLSRWVPNINEYPMTEIPSNLWFANQTSSFSCATVAIMNIINNCPGLDLGQSLEKFKKTTMDLSSKDRGLALDKFDHVRNIHNSFASEVDKMTVDLKLKEDALAAARKKKPNKTRKRKGRKRRKTKSEAETDEEEEGESGLHFIAYVATENQVWRMDGLDPTPQYLGILSKEDNWLNTVLPDLQSQWESATTNQLEYSLLSLSRRQNNDVNTLNEEVDKMCRTREQWGPFIANLVQLHAERGDLKVLLE